jgi:hypothetical protein
MISTREDGEVSSKRFLSYKGVTSILLDKTEYYLIWLVKKSYLIW